MPTLTQDYRSSMDGIEYQHTVNKVRMLYDDASRDFWPQADDDMVHKALWHLKMALLIYSDLNNKRAGF